MIVLKGVSHYPHCKTHLKDINKKNQIVLLYKPERLIYRLIQLQTKLRVIVNTLKLLMFPGVGLCFFFACY